MTHLEIILTDNECAVYNPGNKLRGSVELKLDKVTEVLELFVVINGKAYAQWQKKSKKNVFEGKEIYLDKKLDILPKSDETSPIEIMPGLHSFEFEFSLPKNLPSSVKVKDGIIEYSIEAFLVTSTGVDGKTSLDFTVVRKDDYNHVPKLKDRREKNQKIKVFNWFTCSSKALLVTVSLPCTVCTPGSTIPITILLDNQSSTNVDHIQIRLKQFIDLKSTQSNSNSSSISVKTNKTEKIVAEFKAKGVMKHSSKDTLIDFDIPKDLLTSNDPYCNVVQIFYCLEVQILKTIIKFGIIVTLVPIVHKQKPRNMSVFIPLKVPSIVVSQHFSDSNLNYHQSDFDETIKSLRTESSPFLKKTNQNEDSYDKFLKPATLEI